MVREKHKIVTVAIVAVIAIFIISFVAGTFHSSFSIGEVSIGELFVGFATKLPQGPLKRVYQPSCAETDTKTIQQEYYVNGKITFTEVVEANQDGKLVPKYQQTTLTDACKDKTYLQEYSCKKYPLLAKSQAELYKISSKLNSFIKCKFGCDVKKGACLVAPSCSDGIKNGDETGVDCGGTMCKACVEKQFCQELDASLNFSKKEFITAEVENEQGEKQKTPLYDYCKKDAQGNPTDVLLEQTCNEKGAAEVEKDCAEKKCADACVFEILDGQENHLNTLAVQPGTTVYEQSTKDFAYPIDHILSLNKQSNCLKVLNGLNKCNAVFFTDIFWIVQGKPYNQSYNGGTVEIAAENSGSNFCEINITYYDSNQQYISKAELSVGTNQCFVSNDDANGGAPIFITVVATTSDSCGIILKKPAIFDKGNKIASVGPKTNGIAESFIQLQDTQWCENTGICNDGACIPIDYCKDVKELDPTAISCIDQVLEPVEQQVEEKCPMNPKYEKCSNAQKGYLLYKCLLDKFPQFTTELQLCAGEGSCVDSDNGYDLNTKGTTTSLESKVNQNGEYIGTIITKSTDYCMETHPGQPAPSGKYIVEFECGETPGLSPEKSYAVPTQCPTGEWCFDGACVAVTCVDPDNTNPDLDPLKGSVNTDSFYTKTTVTGISAVDGQLGSSTDYCQQEYLIEAYCSDNTTFSLQIYPCAEGEICSDGACQPKADSCFDTENSYELGTNSWVFSPEMQTIITQQKWYYNYSAAQVDPILIGDELDFTGADVPDIPQVPWLLPSHQFVDNQGSTKNYGEYKQYLRFCDYSNKFYDEPLGKYIYYGSGYNSVRLVHAQDDDTAPQAGMYLYFSDVSNKYAWNYTLAFDQSITYKTDSAEAMKQDLLGNKLTIMNQKFTIIDVKTSSSVANQFLLTGLTLQHENGNIYKLAHLEEVIINGKKISNATGWYAETYLNTSSSAGLLHSFSVKVRPDNDKVYLAPGDVLLDPVFGAFAIHFKELVDEPKETISFKASGKTAWLNFTNPTGHEVMLPMSAKDGDSNVYWSEDAANIATQPYENIYFEGETCVGQASVADCQGARFLVSAGEKKEAHIIKISMIDTVNKKISFEDITYGACKTNDKSYTIGNDVQFSLSCGAGEISLLLKYDDVSLQFKELGEGYGMLGGIPFVDLQTKEKAKIRIKNEFAGNITMNNLKNAVVEAIGFSEYNDSSLPEYDYMQDFNGLMVASDDTFLIKPMYDDSNDNQIEWADPHPYMQKPEPPQYGSYHNFPRQMSFGIKQQSPQNPTIKSLITLKGTKFTFDEDNSPQEITIIHPRNAVYARIFITKPDCKEISTTTTGCDYTETPEKDLSDFPAMFVSNDAFNGYFVLSTNAKAEEVFAVSYLQTFVQSKITQLNTVEQTKLDAGLPDTTKQNMIVVAANCNNNAASCIYSTLSSENNVCFSLQKGSAIVKLIKYPTGYYTLLINGYDSEDVRMAARVFTKRFNEFDGYEVLVQGTFADWQNAQIVKVK